MVLNDIISGRLERFEGKYEERQIFHISYSPHITPEM